MAEYKDIKGFKVQTVSTDPAASIIATGTWASGENFPGGRSSAMGFGIQTAALVGGGFDGTAYLNTTFEYDGTSWTAGGNLTASAGQARGGHGTLTAGGAVAGYKTDGNAVINNYETYDGTSFTEQADLNTARQTLAASGSTTAALAAGGTSSVGPGGSQPGLTTVESWNGSSWSEITEINTGRKQATSFSGSPAPTMIFVGGASVSTVYSNVETYNGTSWTETTDLNTARFALGGAGQTQTDGLVFGGDIPGNTAATENWNGTTWTELADLSTARSSLVGSGTGAPSALATGGYATTFSAATEEWTVAPPASFQKENLGQVFYNSTSDAFKVTKDNSGIPLGTWSSGGNLNTGRRLASGIGTQTANLFAGGESATAKIALTESYNGTSWTEVNDLNSGRGGGSSFGIQTAGIVAGGELDPGANTANTESWDGTNWTEVNDLNTARRSMTSMGAGTQTAGLSIGGLVSTTVQAITESWNGTSFTEVNDMNTARQLAAAHGTQTDALAVAGSNTVYINNVETWNGTSWTEVADVNTARQKLGGTGTSTSFLAYGGNLPPTTGVTEFWNGTSWTEVADLATSRSVGGDSGSGSSSSALASGGSTNAGPAGITTATEEWNAPAPFASNVTLTAS